MEQIMLYAKDAREQIRYWSIWEEDFTIFMEYGLLEGEPIIETEEVNEGKAGRDIEEQIMLRINSRVKRKKDAGYVPSIEEAMENKRTNSLGFVRPMLARKYKDCKKSVKDGNFLLQNKYNGFRCMITNQSGRLFAYTRAGVLLNTLDHILGELKYLPEGTTIDGELYRHGYSLQKIASCVKRDRPITDTKNITYIAYDLVSDEIYSQRYSKLLKIVPIISRAIKVAPTLVNIKAGQIPNLLRERRAEGYEGLILRLDNSGYEDSKRSKSLIKVKAWLDEEFLIVDVSLSDKGNPVFTCITEKGVTFKVTPPGTQGEKMTSFLNKEKYIGRHLQVEFESFTEKGKPFQPVAVRYREPNQD